jgi:hypothetical protein
MVFDAAMVAILSAGIALRESGWWAAFFWAQSGWWFGIALSRVMFKLRSE